MRGNAQPDGRPLVGSQLRFYFRRLWTKVHRIKFACLCGSVRIVCNTVFRLTMSCRVPEIFAIKSQICPKSRRIFDVFGPPHFWGRRGHPNFWPNFINLNHQSDLGLDLGGRVWWRSAKRPRRLGGEKKKKERYKQDRGKTEWLAAIIIIT